MARVLMILSAADALTLRDGTARPTGIAAEELALTHRTLRGAGHTVDLATPGGRRPATGTAGLQPEPAGGPERSEQSRALLRQIDAQLASPRVLAEVDGSDYDALLLPDGRAAMADLHRDPALGRMLVAADRSGRVVAALCHGPAGLLSARSGDGFHFAGRRLTACTNEEELAGGTGPDTPWFLETVLREQGAVVETGPAWTSHVVRDGNLVTGQNPQSGEALAEVLVELLGE